MSTHLVSTSFRSRERSGLPDCTPVTDAPSSHPRIGALDGLRGLAVVGVLLFHSGLLSGGFLGVSLFFTLSGFLIVSLLLGEVGLSGRVRLGVFWGRRARRLLPAVFVCVGLVLVFVASVGSPGQLGSVRGDVLSALGYVANWRFVAVGRDYGRLFSDPSPVQHFWSLAIEEQFYLVVPLLVAGLVALVGRRRLRWWLGGVFTVLLAGSVVSGWLVSPVHAYYGTDTRAGELLIGALAATMLGGTQGWNRRGPLVDACRFVAPVGLVTLLVWWSGFRQHDAALRHGALALHALVAAVVIVGVASNTSGWFNRVLGWQPLAALGRISYGLYLYHWPIFLWLNPARTGLSRWPLLVLRCTIALALAAVSARWLEEPIRRHRAITGWRPHVLVPLSATALVICTVVVAVGSPQPAVSLTRPKDPPLPNVTKGTIQSSQSSVSAAAVTSAAGTASAPEPATPDPATSEAPGIRDLDRFFGPNARVTRTESILTPVVETVPTPASSSTSTTAVAPVRRPLVNPAPRRAATAPGETPRILVVGDSAALTLGAGLSAWAQQSGAAQVWDAGTLGCAIARGGVHRFIDYEPETFPGRCDDWAAARAEQVAAVHPHLVVVLSGTWDVVDRKLDKTNRWTHIGQPDADRYYSSELAQYLDVVAADGATVVWLDHPAIRAGANEGKAGPFPENDPARMTRLNELAHAVISTRNDTAIVDLRAKLQAEPGGELDLSRRPDGIHWTTVAAKEEGAWLGPLLLDLIDVH